MKADWFVYDFGQLSDALRRYKVAFIGSGKSFAHRSYPTEAHMDALVLSPGSGAFAICLDDTGIVKSSLC